MSISLIPVIDISNFQEDIPSPNEGPYWECADDWEHYHLQCNKKAGFSAEFVPYAKGSSFYKIDTITDNDLLLAIMQEIKAQESDEEDDEKIGCPFDGGYILQVEGIDKYFPQCCGNLSDIAQWENVIQGNVAFFFCGHPSPAVTVVENIIRFDFGNTEIKEPFAPPVKENLIEIEKTELAEAINELKQELNTFRKRLLKINSEAGLNIPNIDNWLIWGKE
jgi:hypothetical protein